MTQSCHLAIWRSGDLAIGIWSSGDLAITSGDLVMRDLAIRDLAIDRSGTWRSFTPYCDVVRL
jgi:hypothetical protein